MRVLVTRPESEARHWVDALRAKGFDAQAFPLIDIAPVDDAGPLVAAWQRLETYRAAMFVSGNAVRHFFLGKPPGAAWPAHTRAWCPGRGTRDALIAAGVEPGQVDAPPAESAQFDSETLWQQVAGQVRAGDRVLIVRGADAEGTSRGRDWLGEQVLAAGGLVDLVAVYRRQAPRLTEAQLAEARQSAADAGGTWIFSSSQAVEHLRSLLPEQDWTKARALATHPRIARAARAAGFGVVCESRPALAAVVAALESFR